MAKKALNLTDLEVYQLAIEISELAWEIFRGLSWEEKKVVGFQFIEAIDSIGANIAEGYGRFHYLDRIKFYYNSRGSLLESFHWVSLMLKRNIGDSSKLKNLLGLLSKEKVKLNNFIRVNYVSKNKA